MATDIQKFFAGHNLPSRDALAKSLASFGAVKNALSGKALLRMNKDNGTLAFGQTNTPITAGTVLVCNPASISAGYIAWYQGQIEGEHMQPVSQGPIEASTLPPVNSGTIPPGKKVPSGQGWQQQSSVDFITRDEVPVSLVFKSSSRGGMVAILGLAGEIAVGMTVDLRRVYPLVALGTGSYQHKEFGTVYTPEFIVVGWLDAEGNEIPEFEKLGKNELI